MLAGDGETIVLGGLIQDDVTETNRRVPVLGSIPLIGNLFKSKTSSRVKTNLLVFIRPTIISSSEQATTLTNKKYSGIWELTTDQKKLNNEDANEESAEALQLLFQGKQDK